MPSPPEELRARAAWQGAAASLVLTFVGWPIEMIMMRRAPEMSLWPPLASMAAAALMAIPLLASRKRQPLALSRWLFLANNAIIVLALWPTTAVCASYVSRWVPFQVHKLSVLTAALIAPELAAGIAVIALFAGSAMLQYVTFDAAVRARLLTAEPWPMIAYAAFAVVVLVHRMRRQSLELALLQARAETLVLRRFAERLLAVRDLANTPLQTIEANTALLAGVHGAELQADRIRRALDRLRGWQRVLETDSHAITGELAFDAHEVLKKEP
jgi:hypothetical protein